MIDEPDIDCLLYYSEGGGRKVNENKALTASKNRYVEKLEQWILYLFFIITFHLATKLVFQINKLCFFQHFLMCSYWFSNLLSNYIIIDIHHIHQILRSVVSVRVQYIRKDHIIVRDVHTRKVLFILFIFFKVIW